MWKVSLRGIEDDVFQRQIETRRTNRHLVRFVRIGCQPVEELGRTSGWRLTQQPGERRPVSAVPFSRGTETAKQMDLKSCGPFELILWQLSHALEEVIRDSHRTHGVRTRRPGTHLIEFFECGHDWTFRLLYHVELRRQGSHSWRRSGGRAAFFSSLLGRLRRGTTG